MHEGSNESPSHESHELNREVWRWVLLALCQEPEHGEHCLSTRNERMARVAKPSLEMEQFQP